ncbi:MAG: ATPase, T2SS/T4P/T4SS family [Polyangiaceae bacterium]
MLVQVVIECTGRTERRDMEVSNGVVTIGRAPTCSLSFESALVSRNHASIDLNGPAMRVTDSSTNGTLAGNVFVQGSRAEVPFGVPIVVGEYTVWLATPERPPALGVPAAPVPIAPMRPVEISLKPTIAPPSVIIAEDALAAAHAVEKKDAAAQLDRANEQAEEKARRENVALRREIHKLLLDHLDLATVEPSKLEDPSLRPKVLNALRRIVRSIDQTIPESINRDALIGELADEALGLGPLERFLSDPSVNEIMVVDPDTIYIEQKGKLFQSEARFTDDERVRAVIERIVTPLGRRIDESSPLVDARLSDGSRVNAVIRPLALRGSAITIRKFSRSPLDLEKLVSFGALTKQMGSFLTRCVIAKKNIVIAGGTGSGKTTLLNVLSGAIPSDERIVTIEDAAELQLRQPHVVSLETRPANMEGKGEYSIRDLVKNALRMRPDRIVVGECRGGEALDMLQAMNTGHDGSLTTTHANSAREAVARLETLCLMAGIELPVRAIREQIAGSVHLLVQQSRLSDGSRKVTAITEVVGINDEGDVELVPIFQFYRTGTGDKGKVLGEFRATGFLPTFLNDFIVMGLMKRGEAYL